MTAAAKPERPESDRMKHHRRRMEIEAQERARLEREQFPNGRKPR